MEQTGSYFPFNLMEYCFDFDHSKCHMLNWGHKEASLLRGQTSKHWNVSTEDIWYHEIKYQFSCSVSSCDCQMSPSWYLCQRNFPICPEGRLLGSSHVRETGLRLRPQVRSSLPSLKVKNIWCSSFICRWGWRHSESHPLNPLTIWPLLLFEAAVAMSTVS